MNCLLVPEFTPRHRIATTQSNTIHRIFYIYFIYYYYLIIIISTRVGGYTRSAYVGLSIATCFNKNHRTIRNLPPHRRSPIPVCKLISSQCAGCQNSKSQTSPTSPVVPRPQFNFQWSPRRSKSMLISSKRSFRRNLKTPIPKKNHLFQFFKLCIEFNPVIPRKVSLTVSLATPVSSSFHSFYAAPQFPLPSNAFG